MDEVIAGIVLPISRTHAERVFRGGKDVLVKYLSRIPKRKQDFRLRKGMKLIFYVTESGRLVAGEAEIRNLCFLLPQDTIKKYGKRLILSTKELLEYANVQPGRTLTKPLVVLELSRAQKYEPEVTYPRNISMVGEYLRPNVYKELVGV